MSPCCRFKRLTVLALLLGLQGPLSLWGSALALSPVALSPDALPPKAVTLVAQGYSLNTDWTEESLYYKLKKKFYLRDGRLTQRERRDLLKIRRKELMKQRQQQLNRARFGLG